MKHEGPDPSEALPIGEDPLSPEQLNFVSNYMMLAEESIQRLAQTGIDFIPLMSPENQAAIRAMRQRAKDDLYEHAKKEARERFES